MPEPLRKPRRFNERKSAFVATATRLINRKGVSGMSLADVTSELGMAPKAIAHYFKDKDDLAASCFLDAIGRMRACVAEAAHDDTPDARVVRFLRSYFALKARVAEGKGHELVAPNDIRALNNADVNGAYAELFRELRGLLVEAASPKRLRPAQNAATFLLISHCHWSLFWLPSVWPERYPRTCDRLADILLCGLAAPGVLWNPRPMPPVLTAGDPDGDSQMELFLRAATELINEQGYHGASVERISARLKVSKGSFYHHIDSKDELVLACFERTFDVFRRTIPLAEEQSKSGFQTLCTFVSALARVQVSGVGLLLRLSAGTTLPEGLRQRVQDNYTPIINLIASIVSEGISDGSIRPVDSLLAAQTIMGMINAADELRFFVPDITPAQTTDDYVKPCFLGLFNSLAAT